MPTTSNFNVQPYNDDYNPSREDINNNLKNFYKILFRPSYSIQARELTQIQSILQNQIASFGEHIFKDGSMVIPGEISITSEYEYVRLQKATNSNLPNSSLSSISDLIGATLTGSALSISATIHNATEADSLDPPTLYVQYEKGDGGLAIDVNSNPLNIRRFLSGELLTYTLSDGVTQGTFSVESNTPNGMTATGQGSAATIQEGVYFINGFCVKNIKETLILDKYNNVPDYRIGFQVTQSFVNSFTDQSLNDNATGSSNLNAPGADRFSISIKLAKKEISNTDSTDFVELLQLNNGTQKLIVKRTDYNLFEEVLARRTHDESGDYVIKNFEISMREHNSFFPEGKYSANSNSKFESIYTDAQSKGLFVAEFSSGKAYVRGYENETTSTKSISISKGRDFDFTQNSVTRLSLGNSININKIHGTPDLTFNSNLTQSESYKELTLYKAVTSTKGSSAEDASYTGGTSGSGTTCNEIGKARPRFFEYVSGTTFPTAGSTAGDTTVYKLGLFDIKLFTHVAVSALTAARENTTPITYSLNVGGILRQPSTGASGVIEAISNARTGGPGVFVLSNVVGQFLTGSDIENERVYDSAGSTGTGDDVIPVTKQGAYGQVTAVTNFTFKSVKQIFMPGNAPFTADTVTNSDSEAKLQGVTDTCPVYKLPQKIIKTLKLPENQNIEDSIYKVRKQFLGTMGAISNNVSVISFIANSQETFAAYSPIDYTLTVTSGSGKTGTIINLDGSANNASFVVSTSSGTSTLTITLLGTSATNYTNQNVKLTATLIKRLGSAKIKQKATSQITVGTAGTSNVLANRRKVLNSTIGLGKTDGFKLNAVYMSADFKTTATTSDTNITDRFTLDNGQRESYYDVARINRKPLADPPTGLLLIDFDHFNITSAGTGDYCTVDSYTPSSGFTYADIPSFKSSTKGLLNLRDSIDFRPSVNATSNIIGYDGDASGAKSFDSGGSPSLPIKPSSDFICDFEYFLGRIDSVGLNIHGQFKVSKGISSLNPQKPVPFDNVMILYYLYIPPFTFNVNNVKITPVINRRYTMRDIGKLEQRINNIEYYTQLTFLENSALNSEVLDASGNSRFKNGILVDTFEGHNIAETTAFDHQCSIDMVEGELRAGYVEKVVELQEVATTDAQRLSLGYQKTGDLITLPYSHVAHIELKHASKAVNCNPLVVFTYDGTMTLDPDIDTWKHPIVEDRLNIENKSLYAFAKNLGDSSGNLGTVWNGWETQHYGVSAGGTNVQTTGSGGDIEVTSIISRTKTVRSNTGTSRSLNEGTTIQQHNFGDRVVDIGIVNYMRPRGAGTDLDPIAFTATNMKPNVRVYAFFEDVDVNQYVQLKNSDGTFNAAGGALITDAIGIISGIFNVPDPNVANNPRFKTGDRVFRLTSSPTNDQGTSITNDEIETYANATFTARGLKVTTQNTVQSTKVPEIIKGAVNDFDERTTVDNISINASASALRADITNLQEVDGILTSNQNLLTNQIIEAGSRVDKLDASFGVLRNEVTVLSKAQEELAEDINSRKPQVQTNTYYPSQPYTPPSIGNSIANSQETFVGISPEMFDRRPLVVNNFNNTESTQVLANTEFAREPAGFYSRNRINTKQQRSKSSYSGNDPLAQTFLNGSDSDASGSFITKVDLYFKKKHPTKGIQIYLTTTSSSRPTNVIISPSTVFVKSSDVNISDDASLATTVTFPSPIYLMPNVEYAIVLKPSNTEYEAWVSRLGSYKINTTERITEEPLGGSLFRSQNARLWTEDQYEDLKLTIYKAKFNTKVNTTGVGTIDFQNKTIPSDILDSNPFQTNSTASPSSGSTTLFGFNPQVVRVHHKNHGMNSSKPSTVVFTGATNVGSSIGASVINRTSGFTLSNVRTDSYTINVGVDATSTGRSGGISVTASREHNFQILRPEFGELTYDTGKILHSVKTVSARSPQGNETAYTLDSSYRSLVPNESYYYDNNRSVLSSINEQNSLNSAKSLQYRVSLMSFDESTSPAIDIKHASVNLINNRINSITGNTIKLLFDENAVDTARALQEATAVSNASEITYVLDKILTENEENILTVVVDGIVKSKGDSADYIVITSSSDTRITFLTALTVGDTLRVFLDDMFVPETNPQGGSALAKYLTKEIILENASTALDVRFSASAPPNSSLEVYAKTKTQEDGLRMEEIGYIKLNSDDTPAPNTNLAQSPLNPDYFLDFSEYTFSNSSAIDEFTSFQIKIVMKGTNPAYPPRIRDLRILALAL